MAPANQPISELHDLESKRIKNARTELRRQRADPDPAETIARLRSENASLRGVLEQIPYGLCAFDVDDRLVLANTRYREIWSLPETAVRPGTTFTDIVRLTQGAETPLSRSELHPVVGADGCRRQEWRLDNGHVVEVVLSRRVDGSCVTLHSDITELREAQSRIAFMARHDLLTGLPNRSTLREEVARALTRGSCGEQVALLCIGLDGLKAVNDAFGVLAGDALLQEAATRLRHCAKDTDVVVRLDGDQFALVQSGVSKPSMSTALAQRIIEALSKTFHLDIQTVDLDVSIGIALAPADGVDSETLLRNAELALYRATGAQRGTFRFFEAEMDAHLRARNAIEGDLRRALETDQFSLAYQPQFSIEDGSLCGVEALLRWQHPQFGPVPPLDFIAIAEETKLVVPIGRWALRQACADALAWPGYVRVAVNVSAVQFESGELLDDVFDALRSSGLPARRLELEVTESALLQDTQQVLTILHELRSRGVSVALDDFGTGYSSLSYLRSFPFDRIKIDRSFVRDVDSNLNTQAIIRAVIDLGRSMGMCTTVEGVETAEQMAAIRRQGPCEVQGFLLSKPRPAEEIEALLCSVAIGDSVMAETTRRADDDRLVTAVAA